MTINVTSNIGVIRGMTMSISKIATTINTSQHKNALVKSAFAVMSGAFNDHMDLVAPAQSSRFNHVYEWNQIGNPTARLWTNVLRGTGGDRSVGFDFRASKTIVPVPDIPPSKSGAQFKPIHVFVWKAPIMEYNMPVVIRPQLNEVLGWLGNDGLLHFSRKPITITNPGGGATTGAFTSEFVKWWPGVEGQRVLQEQFIDEVERTTTKSYEKGAVLLNSIRVRNKTVSMTTDPAIASTAAKIAKLTTGDLTNKYIEMARQRLRFING